MIVAIMPGAIIIVYIHILKLISLKFKIEQNFKYVNTQKCQHSELIKAFLQLCVFFRHTINLFFQDKHSACSELMNFLKEDVFRSSDNDVLVHNRR